MIFAGKHPRRAAVRRRRSSIACSGVCPFFDAREHRVLRLRLVPAVLLLRVLGDREDRVRRLEARRSPRIRNRRPACCCVSSHAGRRTCGRLRWRIAEAGTTDTRSGLRRHATTAGHDAYSSHDCVCTSFLRLVAGARANDDCGFGIAHAVTSVGPAPRGLLSSAGSGSLADTPNESVGRGGHPGLRGRAAGATRPSLTVAGQRRTLTGFPRSGRHCESPRTHPVDPLPDFRARHDLYRCGAYTRPGTCRAATSGPGTVPRQRNNAHVTGKPVGSRR